MTYGGIVAAERWRSPWPGSARNVTTACCPIPAPLSICGMAPRPHTALTSTRNISFPINRGCCCIWMHVSENDLGAQTASTDRRNWVIANQRLAGVLKAKGFHYQFVYSKNSGHVDRKVISQDAAASAGVHVWRGYPISGK